MQVDSFKTRVESAHRFSSQRLKLEYHKMLSLFAFKFNLRQYTQEIIAKCKAKWGRSPENPKVGMCRLTPD